MANVFPNVILTVLCATLDRVFERSASCLFITGLWLRYGIKVTETRLEQDSFGRELLSKMQISLKDVY
jgi:hypothetical protein